VFSPNVFIARRTIVAELTLALSVLSACSYDSSAPTYPDTPPPSPAPTAVDVAYCRGAEPAWVAFQDGDGAWTRAQPIAAGQYTTFHHAFTSNRGAVARAQEFAGGLTSLSILYGLPSELRIVTDTAFQQCSTDALRTLNGTVAGLGANDVALVSAGNSVRDFTALELGNSWQLRGLLAGPQEFLATRGTRLNGVVSLTKMILRRSPGLPDGATLPTFDFESPEAFQPVVHNVTFAGNNGSAATAYTGLRTAHSNNILSFLAGGGATATSPYFAIPESQLESGELQSVGATTVPVGNVVRSAAAYFRSPADLTLTFGVMPVAPTLSTIATAPTVRMRAHFVVQDDYDRLATINFQQGANTVVSLSMTEPYARGDDGYDLTIPDLSAVPGFDSRWALHTGTQVLWTSARIGGTLASYYNAMPYDGDVSRVATDAGFFTP
jgi:hypothetical protein